MTEDPRISEIRAVLTEYVSTSDLDAQLDVRRRIRAIVDREPPAPRVFFPGDTVPGDVPMACLVNTDEGQFVGLLEAGNVDFELSKHVGPVVELRDVPSIEEWQAAVDRARDARANAEWQHTEGVTP